jgi:uncharacterized protein YecE (DUF72 family)
MPSQYAKWADQTPYNFTFTIKVDLYITHQKKLNNPEEWWSHLQECADALGHKFCCFLFQFPPLFKCTPANIEKLREVIKMVPLRYDCALEFRDMLWYIDDTLILPDNWTVVNLVIPLETEGFGNLDSGFNISATNTNKRFSYVRFHGTLAYSAGSYPNEILSATLSTTRTDTKRKMCFYFNNTDTWEFRDQPITMGILYARGIVRNIHILPSAIRDAMTLKMLSQRRRIVFQ